MNLKDANNLFLEGQIALAQIESHGIAINEKYLDFAIKKVSENIATLEKKLYQDEVWSVWTKLYGDKTKINSRQQFGKVLFEEMKIKYPSREKTKTGRFITNETVLSQVDVPFVKRFLKIQGLKKLKTTYLLRLKDGTIDGFYHPEHYLNTVTTYRSSADGIQTIPKRDEKARTIIRRCFIPRPGYYLVATDYGSHEFRGAAMFWKDKAMMEYASNPKLDIHRDMAAKMFLCKPEQVNSDLRYLGKNGWVFPRLYGSYYIKIAQAVWPEIEGKVVGDVPLKDWLKSKGILERGLCDKDVFPPEKNTFEHHLLQVQKEFDQMFPTWATGRDEWYNLYRKRGWFRHPTGFVQRGLYTRNDLLNHPIQGSLFHCLVWSLITLVNNKTLKELGIKILAEIHDEILADVPKDCLTGYLDVVERVMTVDIRKEWKWLTVPLLMEAKASDTSWADMKTVVKKGDIWKL